MNTQDTFKFAETHEWADLEEDGLVWVGISNHAQEALGDVMFFQAPKLGQQVKQGEAIAAIECYLMVIRTLDSTELLRWQQILAKNK
jgi:glycine cleavage system H protein